MKAMNENKKRRYKLDLIVILSIVLIAITSLLIVFISRKPGAVAVVEVNGAVVGEYPLSENGTFTLNGGTNTLVIEDGAAYIINSNCPDHTCENTGKIRYVEQTVICLPNRLSVTVRGEGDGVDFVS